MKKILLLCLYLFTGGYSFHAFAQHVDTVSVFSDKMGREIKNVVILPESYENGKASYPVLYLLHGVGGSYQTWISVTKPTLPADANQWEMIIVCPDGQKSWYWDCPGDPRLQFETYLSKELIRFMDKNYRTVASAKGRAISGYSMGGHGGLWLGINYPDIFGACGAMSGCMDIRPFRNNWDMAKLLGNSYEKDPDLWDNHTVMANLDRIEAGKQAIIFDCGWDDMFYQVNEQLHQKLKQMNIPHEYISRPGKHSQEYWNKAVDYQLQFFHNFFQSNKE